jgi:dihydroorotate dehydrogenase electron transfer subunit
MPLHDWPVKVTLNQKVATGSYEMRLAVDEEALAQQAVLLGQAAPAKEAWFDLQAGQFFMLSLPSDGFWLRRPFSPLSFNKATGEVNLYYKVVGVGTQQLAQLPLGSALQALSPLGKPFQLLAAPEETLLVAGGVGVAPLALLAQLWPQTPTTSQKPRAIYGVRSQSDLFGLQELASGCSAVQVCTDDGSTGLHGNVCDALTQQENWLKSTCKQVLVCGPNPMMAAVVRYLQQLKPDLPVHVSLENHMPCGTGACYGCVVHPAENTANPMPNPMPNPMRVCLEGPTFDARDLLWTSNGLARDAACTLGSACQTSATVLKEASV